MTIDHLGFMIFPDQLWMRIIGRFAFPIFAFLIAEGFRHSSNKNKYFVRLAVFAIVLELPIWILSAFTNTFDDVPNFPMNIFFTLALGLGLLICLNQKKRYYFLLVPVILVIPVFLDLDFGLYGLLSIVVMYYFKGIKLVIYWTLFNVIFFTLTLVDGYVFDRIQTFSDLADYQVVATFSIIFILMYNGTRGIKMKYFFYFYYPVHILIIFGISLLISA